MNTLMKKNGGTQLTDPWMSDFFDVDNLFGRGWLKPFNKTLPAVCE